MPTRHTLYRFFDGTGVLLYVGISLRPWERFKQHRQDKPWWDDVATVTMEHHDTREQVLQAERDAIVAESPLHNVVHNRGVQRPTPTRDGEPSLTMMSTGAYVAIGMRNGKCPVGYVDHIDDQWITLILKSWLTGYYNHERRTYRLDDVEQICYAFLTSDGLVNDDHLGTFQSAWLAEHAGAAL